MSPTPVSGVPSNGTNGSAGVATTTGGPPPPPPPPPAAAPAAPPPPPPAPAPAPRRGPDATSAPPRNISTGSRPYRSHKVRACDLCRKRKSRCTVDLPGQSCLLCRIQGAECHYREDLSSPRGSTLRRLSNEETKHRPLDSSSDISSGRKRKYDQIVPATTGAAAIGPGSVPQGTTPTKTTGPHDVSNTATAGARQDRMSSSAGCEEPPHTSNDRPGLGDSLNETVHIVGPVAAEDAQVIEKYLPSKRESGYNVYSSDPRNPVLYTTVSRRRQGLRATSTPGESQLEILEQILGPFKHDLVDMYVLLFLAQLKRYYTAR